MIDVIVFDRNEAMGMHDITKYFDCRIYPGDNVVLKNSTLPGNGTFHLFTSNLKLFSDIFSNVILETLVRVIPSLSR